MPIKQLLPQLSSGGGERAALALGQLHRLKTGRSLAETSCDALSKSVRVRHAVWLALKWNLGCLQSRLLPLPASVQNDQLLLLFCPFHYMYIIYSYGSVLSCVSSPALRQNIMMIRPSCFGLATRG